MNFIQGGELFVLLRREKKFNEKRAKFYVAQITMAINYLHSNGVIYRDLKPENILIDTQGVIKIMDFGLGMPVRAGVAIEAPGYLSPEQLQAREPDSRADFYSFGAVVYTMLTGNLPFPGSSADEIRRKMAEGVPEAPTSVVADIPPKLEQIILKCLSIAPDQRYSSAEELLRDLDEVTV